jgi:Protein of unknown function (DUF5656)
MTTQGVRGARFSRMRWVDRVNLLAMVVGVLGAFFILRGDWVVLFVLPLIAGLGLDGVLRAHPAARFRGAAATMQQLVCPVAFSVAASLFFRYVSSGYWGFVASIGTGLAFGIVAYAAYFTLDADSPATGAARLVLLAASYAALFGLLAAFYAYDLALPVAAVITAVAATICSVEVFREADLNGPDLVTYTLATGFVIAQVRWAAGFLRIDGLLAAMLLLVVFYVITGVTVAAVGHRLNRRLSVEFLAVGAVGVAIVVAGRLITGG